MSSASSEGESGSSLGAGDAHALGTAIQVLVDQVMEPFLPPLKALAAGAARAESARDELTEAAVRGLRDGVVGHAINGCAEDSFAVTVCTSVRKRAAACLRERGSDCSPDGSLDGHFSELALCRQLGLPDSDAGIASEIEEMRRLANQIVVKHHRLAKAVSRMFRRPGLDRDDLEQEAVIGLRKAALSYRPVDGTPFKAYADLVIRNHLSSVVRTASGATDHFARRIEEFIGMQERRAHEWRRQPNEVDVFEALGWDGAKREKVRSVMRMLSMQALPTAAEDQAEVMVRCPEPGPQRQVALAERLKRLFAALERVPQEQREIIKYRYYGDLSFREIGERVGRTERQVRTRHDNALKTLTREVEGAGSASRSKGSA